MSSVRSISLAKLLDSFFRERLAAQRRASPATVAAYRDSIRLLVLFAAKRSRRAPSGLRIEDLDRDVVLAFLDHLESDRGNTVRTRNARLGAIRSLFRHLACMDPTAMGTVERVLSIPTKRGPRGALDYLTVHELDMLLGSIDKSRPRGRRDYALILFLARTGARVSEAVGVNAVDLRLVPPCQALLRGKGSKERVLPLGRDHAEVLKALRNERRVTRDAREPIFVNARGKRLGRFGVIHILDAAVKQAAEREPSLAMRSISPHTLRHTAAMHLLQSGVDLATIQSWLGHVAITTTHHYVEADLEMKRRALEKTSPTDAIPGLYKPTDDVLALLEAL